MWKTVRTYLRTDVTDWDSNYGESTQMILKTQIKTCCHIHQGKEGEFECFPVRLSFYKLYYLRTHLSTL